MNVVTSETILYFPFTLQTPTLEWDEGGSEGQEIEHWRAAYRIVGNQVKVEYYELDDSRTGDPLWIRRETTLDMRNRIGIALQKIYDRQRSERLYGDAA